MVGHQGGKGPYQDMDCCEGLEKKPLYRTTDGSTCEVAEGSENLFVCIDCNNVVCGIPINKCRCPEECG